MTKEEIKNMIIEVVSCYVFDAAEYDDLIGELEAIVHTALQEQAKSSEKQHV